ncbi:unnamed protein product [Owenia fusiformis]|uniref:Nidogen n=1 Tax=Owenia fusiformis TaxID=6347 RepID=A0A8S4PIZ5_OWEFU|nr:unnamed protein product [Owenia fusiformis]
MGSIQLIKHCLLATLYILLVEVHTVRPNVDETCATGASKCHATSTCQDYYDDRTFKGGYCCECSSALYGNGVNCLEPRKAQRVNGRVTGSINGVQLNVDLHSYVVTIDGRSYTAISRSPTNELGFSMQSLSAIGGIVGWLFAVPTNTKNGFMVTGGVFNRTLTITFQKNGNKLKVKQQMLGPSPELMRMNTEISGTIPRIPQGAKVSIEDYKEEYRRVSPGVIKSYATRTFRINGVSQRFTLDQVITYKECPFKAPDVPDVLRLSVTRNFVTFQEKEQIVRYAMTTKIAPVTGGGSGDPCRDEGLICDSKATCELGEGGYRCVCKAGFTGSGQQCVDEDECQLRTNDCHPNARCINTNGGFQCRCNTGYNGDGKICERDNRCGTGVCDANARCVYNSDEGIEMCECLPGYYGSGYDCKEVEAGCDVVNNCDDNAECVFNRETRRYQCECNDDFSGDGVTCTEGTDEPGCRDCDTNAQCIYDESRLMYRCQCREGYTGDGNTCSELGEQGCEVLRNCGRDASCTYDDYYRKYACKCNPGFEGDGYRCTKEEAVPCNRINNCDPNAECTRIPSTGEYQCRCLRGFQGDGYLCTQSLDCRSDATICDSNARCTRGSSGYVCSCNRGYSGDGTRCVLQGDQGSYLVYAQGMSIMKVPFEPNQENPGTMILHIPGQTAVGVGADCQDRMVYWTDVSGNTINRASFEDGSGSEMVFEGLGSPEGIAIDWIARNIYWTDSGLDRIEVAKIDGTNRKTIIEGDLVNPRAIAIDPRRGTLYWTDWNRKAPKIEMSSMDGSERHVIVDDNLGLPNGLTVDYDTEQLCWADAGSQHIECARPDGSGRKVIYNLASYPFDIAQANGNLYWTDWDMKSIPNIAQNGGTPNEPIGLPPAIGVQQEAMLAHITMADVGSYVFQLPMEGAPVPARMISMRTSAIKSTYFNRKSTAFTN